MRTSRVMGLCIAVALLIVPATLFASVDAQSALTDDMLSSAPSKVCHPKKPVTCRAADLTPEPSSQATVNSDSRFESQQAAICFGPRWACRAGNEQTLDRAPADTKLESQQAAICFGPRWACRAGNELTEAATPSVKSVTAPRLESEQAAICFGPRWACRTDGLN